MLNVGYAKQGSFGAFIFISLEWRNLSNLWVLCELVTRGYFSLEMTLFASWVILSVWFIGAEELQRIPIGKCAIGPTLRLHRAR